MVAASERNMQLYPMQLSIAATFHYHSMGLFNCCLCCTSCQCVVEAGHGAGGMHIVHS